jgi:tetratricopeptide (TPR) repeat protein
MRTTLVVLTAATLFLALSGFDCASTEMTTAKLAIQKKDFQKAEEFLRKEVGARPQNSEAWMMLGELYEQQGKYGEMNEAYDKAIVATQPSLTPSQKTNIHAKRYNAWLENYNGALGLYNDAIQKSDRSLYQQALQRLDAAERIRPDYAENLYLRATIYRAMEDAARETETYRKYIDALRHDVETGMKAGLALGMTPAQVETKLGKATSQQMSDTNGGFMYYQPNDLYVYFTGFDRSGSNRVEGWKYFTDASTPDLIRQAPYLIRSAPYYTLGVDAYYAGEKDRARYNQALDYLQLVQRLDMQQEKVGQVIADIYSRTGRTAEAKSSFEQSIRDNPNDPALYINYGTLLVNLKDYDGAIENFRKVLSLSKEGEEKHQTALFNLGAVYKNWGAALQDSLNKLAKGKMSNAQIEVYSAKLRESAKYFEEYRKSYGGTDYIVLVELGNLYLVLGDESKFNESLKGLEGLEAANSGNYEYWEALSRLYVIKGDTKKADTALKRADALK